MFINENKLISMVKTAYKKGGITYGNMDYTYCEDSQSEESIYIASDSWAICFEKHLMSNKLKGLLVELTGDLPRENQCYEVSASKPIPQSKIEEVTVAALLKNAHINNNNFVDVPILFKDYRLIQLCKSKEITAINNAYFDVIDFSKMDYGFESEPMLVAKSFNNDKGLSHIFYWKNEISTYLVLSYKFSNQVTKALETIDFSVKENRLEGIS